MPTPFARASCVAVTLGLLAAPAAAAPQRDPVAAEALFSAAKALVDAGDWPGGCAKFAASQEADPAVSTLAKIAKCHEHEGKLATAWFDLQQALKLNRDKADQPEKRRADLETFIRAEVAKLEPRVPKLRVVVGTPPPGLVVERDGREQSAATLGEALPVDVGAHQVRVRASGFVAQEHNVTLAEGQTLDLPIHLVPVGAAPAVLETPRASSEAPASDAPSRSSSRKTIGYVVGGVGVAGAIVGGVFAGLTLAKVGAAAPTEAGNADRDTARGYQTASVVSFIAGGAALTTGIVLVVTAPKAQASASSSPPSGWALGVGPAGARATRTW